MSAFPVKVILLLLKQSLICIVLDCIRMYNILSMKKLLLTNEVAEMLRVSEEYVRELLRQRKIKGYKEGRRSGYRVPEEEVVRYIDFKMKLAEKNKKIG